MCLLLLACGEALSCLRLATAALSFPTTLVAEEEKADNRKEEERRGGFKIQARFDAQLFKQGEGTQVNGRSR